MEKRKVTSEVQELRDRKQSIKNGTHYMYRDSIFKGSVEVISGVTGIKAAIATENPAIGVVVGSAVKATLGHTVKQTLKSWDEAEIKEIDKQLKDKESCPCRII
jgi:hypothetical protein